MSKIVAKLVFASVMPIILAASAHSQVKTIKDMSAPVTQGSSVKYSDLLKLVFPDLEVNATMAFATRTVTVTHVSNDHDPLALEGDFELSSIDTITLRDPSGPLTLLQFDLTPKNFEGSTLAGDNVSLVAVFRTIPAPKLVDVVDVKSDQFTEIPRDQTTFPFSANQDAFMVVNYHGNTSGDFELLSGFFLLNGKIHRIFEMFLLQGASCGLDMTEKASFSTRANTASRLPGVLIRVKVVKRRDRPDCDKPTPGFVRFYSGMYRWDRTQKRYVTSSPDMDRLDKLNKGQT